MVNNGKKAGHAILNKLAQFRAGLRLQSHACCLCNKILDKCDDPYKPYKLTSLFSLIQDIQNNQTSLKQAGYYPMKNIIFHQSEFCQSRVNNSAPVEPLHCVL